MTLRFDMRINQGETFRLEIPVLDMNNDPVSVDGMIVRAQVRAHGGAPSTLHEWSQTADNISATGSIVRLQVSAAESAAWSWRVGNWDLELVDGAGNVTRLVEGHVIVHPEITKSA